ncbi:MAG: LysM peptidoglycan-binding domain-containing protein [Opitutales bacterium]
MENDSLSSSSPSESKLPLVIGVIGFALGAAGLVIGIKAKSAAEGATEAANAAQQAAADVGSALASKAPLGELQNLQSMVASNQEQANSNFANIATELQKLQKVATTPKAGPAPKGQVVAGAGEYVVAKGDTLSGIAKKNGLSLKALQDLNPDANPTRLQIGQKLKVK